jgi:hypothetical protein
LKGSLVGGLVEIEYYGLVGSEVNNLVKIGIKLECTVKGLKNGIGVPMSETTSKVSSYNNPEEAFNKLIPKYFSSN